MVRVRPFAEGDRADVANLHADSWRRTYGTMVSPRDLEDVLLPDIARRWQDYRAAPGDVVLTARDGERLAGFCAIWCRPDPYLDNLHVVEVAQGRGIARLLLRHAANILVARGFDTLKLTVFSENRHARAVYARLGGIEEAAPPYRLGDVSVPSVTVRWDGLAPLRDGG